MSTEAASTPAGPSMKQTLIAAAVVTVIALGMGALFALPSPLLSKEGAPRDQPAAPAGAAARESAPTGFFDLPPIVTNLGGASDVWIRLEASIVYDTKALPHPEAVAGEIAADELAYLRTATLAQMEGPIGMQGIRQDLAERAKIRSGGKVSELIIRTLVVQ
ncbi:MAG: flagellar basal body-associated FliL family protein [Hyphomicrobiales bacterium]|nr:flagellar basal body-associated FliL family protein [Hyphomicrobiales bacterium]